VPRHTSEQFATCSKYINVVTLCYNPYDMNSPAIRVGLDGFFLSQPATGSGQYTLHLWNELAPPTDGVETILLRPAGVSDESGGASVNVRFPPFARSAKARKLWWEQFGVLRGQRLARPNLLHIPYMSAPRANRRRTVVTIHDVIPLLYPEYGGSTAMRLYLRVVLPAARRATLILTDSECSRSDIVRLLGVNAKKVRSIPLAVSTEFHPASDPVAEAEIRQRLGLPGAIVFNVGGLDVRKNLATLIEAFGQARPSIDDDARLVIGGSAHTNNATLYPPLEPIIQKWGLERQVVLPGRISEADKLLLYRISALYVYPSLYEGFGFTPLEAMACGLPVISSNRSSLPEVVGDGGLVVEPNADRMAAAIVSLLTDDQRHRDLSARALEQAAHFSWARTAQQTREAYWDASGLRPIATNPL
jgi:glycosyltransferase involved in cell wall biosynthesis